MINELCLIILPLQHNCSGAVIKELEKLLSNVTVQEEDEHYIQELLKNLNILPHRHNDANVRQPEQLLTRSV